MATTPQRRRPTIKPKAVDSDDVNATEADEDDLEDGTVQDDPESLAAIESDGVTDVHALGGAGQPMDGDLATPIPTITAYPSWPDPVPPMDAYVIDTDNKAQADWFVEDPNNSDVVYAKQDIVEKVVPFNCVTPTFVQRMIKGTELTKRAVNELLG